jgi:hypothetical protein
MSISENVRELARDGVSTADIARQLGIRYQQAYSVLKKDGARTSALSAALNTHVSDFAGALVLVSCVSQKVLEPAPARLLYRSDWFVKVRSLVEKQSADWFILSALYGVVAPDDRIAPYEKTLNGAHIAERRAWSENAYRQLTPYLTNRRRIVMFAGQRYREFLMPALRRAGHEVDVPMANLRIGEQLAWLAAQS